MGSVRFSLWLVLGLIVAMLFRVIGPTPFIVALIAAIVLWHTGLPQVVKFGAAALVIILALASPVIGPTLKPTTDSAKTQVGKVSDDIGRR